MHALLCREYVKGRDWYDFIWYMGNRIVLNHTLLTAALNQQGKWAGQGVPTDDVWVREELKKVIADLDWEKAKTDVAAFVHASDLKTLEFFTPEYFTSLADRIGN